MAKKMLPDITVREMPSTDRETSQEIRLKHKVSLTKYRVIILIILIVGFVKDLAMFGTVIANIAKPLPVAVVRGNGEKERVEFQTGLERSPATVKSFVISSMRNLHTWVNVLPGDNAAPDPGIAIEGRSNRADKIPTIVFRYSLAIEDNFAKAYRKTLAELISASRLQDPETQVAYKISQTTEPVKLKNVQYKMSLVGNLLVYRLKQEPRTISFNRTVTVKAIPPFALSEAMLKYPADENIAQALTLVTANGLQITNISDYKDK